jgi:thioredoxin 2
MNRRAFLGEVPLARPGRRVPFLSGRARLGAAQAITDPSLAMLSSKAILDLWSPNCPACVSFKPIFEEVASQSDIPMYTVNLEEAKGVAAQFAVEGIPTVVYLQNGKEVHRTEGSMPKEDFLAEIAKAFGSASPTVQTMAPTSAPAANVVPAAAPAPSESGGILPAFGLVAGFAAVGLLGYLIFGR